MSAGSSKAMWAKEPTSTRLFLPVLVASVFVTVLTAFMVNVVLPPIREDFAVSEAQLGWVVTGFMLVMAVGIPLNGRISDFYSMRLLFSLALVVFAAGSLICALAPNLPALVFGRIVQAAGNAAIPSLATVAVARTLPPGERGGALGLIASGIGAGTVVGPILGGAVEQLAGWHAIFYASLFLSLLLVPGALYALPDGDRGGERRLDLIGGLLLGLGAGLFLFGVTQGQAAGFASSSSWGSLLGAALAAALFARRIASVPYPFIPPVLFGNRAYVAAVVVGGFSYLANISMYVFVPLLVVGVNGLSPAEAGLVLAPGAVAFAALSPLTGRLSDHLGVKPPVLAGLTVMALSVFFVSAFGAGASPLTVSLGMLGIGIGFAFANPPTTNAVANALPRSEVGAGMGIFQGLFFLGGGAGPALIGAFLAARRGAGAEALNPLYALDDASFSDAFLALTAAVIVAMVAALGLRGGTEEGGKGPSRPGKGGVK
jgi:DHA2 family metal-tetracycline-proton antiporter-like MFS transporter/DHA2 family florfenicol/chloramphenicol resistance protein-like MFS transporter